MKKLPLSDGNIQLNGLPWYEHNGKRFWRLPHEIEEQLSRDLWACSKQTTGGRIRFRSDTVQLGLLADFTPYDSARSTNTGLFGRMGIDLYSDGKFWKNLLPLEGGEFEGMFFTGAESRPREFTIYLPAAHNIDVARVIFDDDAAVSPPAPFAVPKPVVFYGTSITQGGCASRPGLTYQAMLCRDLNLDFVNLGFSGLGKGDLPVARAMAQLDASCYLLDYAQNNETVEDFARVYPPFLAEIRNARPDTPIILTTPIYYTAEQWSPEFHDFQERRRDVVRTAYQAGRDAGDRRLYLVEGNDLLGPDDGDGQVDGGHPNDLGFAKMSAALKAPLRAALGLSG